MKRACGLVGGCGASVSEVTIESSPIELRVRSLSSSTMLSPERRGALDREEMASRPNGVSLSNLEGERWRWSCWYMLVFFANVIPIEADVQAQHAQLRTNCGAGWSAPSNPFRGAVSTGVTVHGAAQDGHWKHDLVHLSHLTISFNPHFIFIKVASLTNLFPSPLTVPPGTSNKQFGQNHVTTSSTKHL